jgi:hypothetical protein
MQCDVARESGLIARDFFLDHRLAFLLLYISLINVGTQLLDQWARRLPMHAFLDDEQKFATPTRLMQSCLSPLFLLGYVVLIINAGTGCNVSELFIFYVAPWAPFFDLHEIVRRWPLRSSLAVHHYATLGMCIAIVDLRVIPSATDRDAPFSPFFVAFFGGLGLQWGTDVFSSVFRLSTSVAKIRFARQCYMLSAVPRLANSGCLLLLGIDSGRGGNWFGMCFATAMSCSHAFEQQRSLRWVYHFDVEKYFAKHQAVHLGLETKELDALNKVADAAKRQRRSWLDVVSRNGTTNEVSTKASKDTVSTEPGSDDAMSTGEDVTV